MADERPDDKPLQGNGGEGSRGPEEGRRRFGRRGFRGRAGGQGLRKNQAGSEGELRGEKAEEKRELPACPLCGKPVYDLSTAVSAAKETGDPAHFDCVLERVSAAESLGPQEKLVYLGSGSFGVVEFKDKNESAFTVKRRIQWEKEGEKKDWRKGLSSRISNL
jgi:hypothetical protein